MWFFRAKLRRLEFETWQGKLIEAAIVKERWAAILVVLKERILAVPDKLAPEIAAPPTTTRCVLARRVAVHRRCLRRPLRRGEIHWPLRLKALGSIRDTGRQMSWSDCFL